MSGVVVGVDGSAGAGAALRWALHYAERADLDLTVVTVVDPMVLTALWTARPEDSTDTAVLEAAHEDVQRLLDEVGTGSRTGRHNKVSVQVVCGHPVQALVNAATGADLLVVGSRGAGGFSRMFLGSVSSGVVHHAHCPTVVVPQR